MYQVEPAMHLRVIDESAMPAQLDERIRAALCVCFPADTAAFQTSRAWHGSAPEFSVVLADEEQIAAHVGVVRRTIQVSGQPLCVAGVQNVFVLPAQRGRGQSTTVMEAAMAEAGRREFDCGLLFCVAELERVYARCGWQFIDMPQVIRVENGHELPLPGQNIALFYPLRVCHFPRGSIHLGGNDW